MPGGLTLLAATPASIPTPPANKVTIFFNISTGSPSYKDSTGTVFPLTGPQGIAGSFIVGQDGVDGIDGTSNIPGNQGPPGNTGATGPQGPPILLEDIIYPDDLFVPAQPGASSGGSPWILAATSTPSGVASVDFTGLGGFADIRVIVSAITFAVASRPTLRVSTDNGSTFFATGGDYVSISGAGGASNASEIEFMDTNLTTSRNGEILLEGCNVSGAPKVSRANFFNSDNFNMRFAINATIIANPINAVRVLATQNFTGGTIYVLGRR